ncbi:hypothetical protein D3C84_1113270 [compost metagenome]
MMPSTGWLFSRRISGMVQLSATAKRKGGNSVAGSWPMYSINRLKTQRIHFSLRGIGILANKAYTSGRIADAISGLLR